MIDTDKYEPTWIDWILHNTREHSSDGWRELSKSLIELSDDDRELIANAPLLLAEVKRLRLVIKNVAGFPKRCSPKLKLVGVNDAMVCMLREAIE